MTNKRNLTLATLALIGASLVSGAAFAQAGGGGGGGGGGGAGGYSPESEPILAVAPPNEPFYPRRAQNRGCSAQSAARIDLPVALLDDLCETQ